jgi:hypothetical protein
MLTQNCVSQNYLMVSGYRKASRSTCQYQVIIYATVKKQVKKYRLALLDRYAASIRQPCGTAALIFDILQYKR